MKKMILLLAVAGILISCNQNPSETSSIQKAPIDSLIENWQNAWNNNDSAAIRNLFADEVVLIDDELVVLNTSDMSKNWIGPFHRYVKNMKVEKLQEWSSIDRAGYTGNYGLDIVVNDSVIGHPHGVFTINWVKTSEGKWQITTANINAFSDVQ